MRGKPGSGAGRPARPRPFIVAYRSSTRGPRWGVFQGRRWRFAREISFVSVPLVLTRVKDGQPEFVGEGVVRCIERGQLVVTA